MWEFPSVPKSRVRLNLVLRTCSWIRGVTGSQQSKEETHGSGTLRFERDFVANAFWNIYSIALLGVLGLAVKPRSPHCDTLKAFLSMFDARSIERLVIS